MVSSDPRTPYFVSRLEYLPTDYRAVFARGLTMGNEFNPFLEENRRPFWKMAGEALRKINQDFFDDPRVDTLILPLFDGITQLKWKEGLLRFLVCSLSQHPLYPDIVERLAQNANYLDLGCCFAQDIRKLAYDGAPTRNCMGIDLEPRFFAVSEDLFKDRGRLQASLLGADILKDCGQGWREVRTLFMPPALFISLA
ncbi:MAG: hypothetical protein Q9219_002961, partial [cf. Caloplaca sp. 3 TL-2023]